MTDSNNTPTQDTPIPNVSTHKEPRKVTENKQPEVNLYTNTFSGGANDSFAKFYEELKNSNPKALGCF